MKLSSPIVVFTFAGIFVLGCASHQQNEEPQKKAQMPGTISSEQTLSSSISTVDIKSLPDTIGIEHQDRVNRFNRMSEMVGIQPPEIDDMQLAAGQISGINYPTPVVRVRFNERLFFDSGKADIRGEAIKILKVIAENMKRDVPDAQLTILGHTDAVGSDAYNIDLSRRRAASVMQLLIDDGVHPEQLSTVAVGETQPIAPNYTEDGRSLNRRVEFMISANEKANLTLVSKRRIIDEYLKTDIDERVMPMSAAKLAIYKPVLKSPIKANAGKTEIELAQTGTVQTKTPEPKAIVATVSPEHINRMSPIEVKKARLNNEFDL
jgi:outer membrane protein OmpA-like peptidoglycan-associated protein